MARLSLLTFIAFALLSSTQATPLESQLNLAVPDELIHANTKWSWESCGSETDGVHIQSIAISPDPPKAGANLTITVVASAQDKIEDGAYADVIVKLGLIKLPTQRFDLCEEARNANATVQCPIEEGSYHVVQTVELPKDIPKARYNVVANAYTKDDDDLFCVNLKVDFSNRRF
ncbi:hypothetical protein BV25DRAFT_1823588 [Artomyces pyxidatus]|uniref:Uncharacterized protein n=1 Tax=Artomyces pyxidatus TaxID=48021 RepID=A0ACB8T7Y8_9AGAM|nr:hypothetical protein BV25DRAFT_1823588 [Artomyces pyxidatus]